MSETNDNIDTFILYIIYLLNDNNLYCNNSIHKISLSFFNSHHKNQSLITVNFLLSVLFL